MGCVNLCVISGRIVKDIDESKDVTTFPSGTKVVRFSIAINRYRKNEDDWTEYVSFIDVRCYGYIADRALSRVQKGAYVIVTGELRQDRWEDKATKAKRSAVFVVCESLVFPVKQSAQGFENVSDNDKIPF